jgi:hypothetical protein
MTQVTCYEIEQLVFERKAQLNASFVSHHSKQAISVIPNFGISDAALKLLFDECKKHDFPHR